MNAWWRRVFGLALAVAMLFGIKWLLLGHNDSPRRVIFRVDAVVVVFILCGFFLAKAQYLIAYFAGEKPAPEVFKPKLADVIMILGSFSVSVLVYTLYVKLGK